MSNSSGRKALVMYPSEETRALIEQLSKALETSMSDTALALLARGVLALRDEVRACDAPGGGRS